MTLVTSHNLHSMNCKYKCSRAKLSRACVAPPASLQWPPWPWCCPTLDSSASFCCVSAFLPFASLQYLIDELSSQGLLLSYSSQEKLCDKHRLQVCVTCKALEVLGCLQCRWEACVAPLASLVQAESWSKAPIRLSCSYWANPTCPKICHIHIVCLSIQHSMAWSLFRGWVLDTGNPSPASFCCCRSEE